MGCFPGITAEASVTSGNGIENGEDKEKNEDKKNKENKEKEAEKKGVNTEKTKEEEKKEVNTEKTKKEVKVESTEITTVSYSHSESVSKSVAKEESSTSQVSESHMMEVDFAIELGDFETKKVFEIPLTGKYTKGDKTIEMDLKKIELGERGRMRIKGKDEDGNYKLKGEFYQDGQVFMQKTYEDTGKVIKLKGKLSDINGDIEGKWFGKHDKSGGSFVLSIGFSKKLVDVTNTHFLGLLETTPHLGLMKFKEGWGVIQEGIEGEFEILYARGTKCTVNFDPTQEYCIIDGCTYA